MKLTIRQIFFIVLLLCIFLMTLRPVADPDFWWHLRTGQLIVQTHAIPHTDPFSFTKAGGPWITHEWLSEVLIFALFQLGQYGLLIFTFSVIITAAFILAYLTSPENTRPYVAGFVLLLAAISTAPTWGVRPQMISLFITSLFLFLLARYRRDGELKFLIPLPFITLVWVNLHAGYFIGLVLIGIYIIGGLMELLLTEFPNPVRTSNPPSLQSILILCGFLGACVLATLANPNGYHIILYPFQTLTSPSMQQLIQEWLSPDFHQAIWQPLAWLILVLIGMGMISMERISPANILLTLIFGYTALHSMRNIPLFALTAIPVLSEQIGSLLKIKSADRISSRPLRLTIPILIACLVLLTGLRFYQVVREQPKTETENFPKAAVDWILVNRPPGNLFNSYSWGGYLIWRTYPGYSVYIDGRADVYGDAFIFDYLSIYRAEPGWDSKLKGNGIQTVLVESDAPLANTLLLSPTWHVAFQDKASIVFIQNGGF
jgi:hypothetical protein